MCKNGTGDMCQQDSKEGLKCKSVNLVIKNCVINKYNDAVKMDQLKMYREAVGSPMYLATCTRVIVSKLSQDFFFFFNQQEQWVTVKICLMALQTKSCVSKEMTVRSQVS